MIIKMNKSKTYEITLNNSIDLTNKETIEILEQLRQFVPQERINYGC